MPTNIFLLLLCIFLFGTNGLILAPLIHPIAADLSVDSAAGVRALAAFGLGTALSAYWFGRALDRFGLRPALRLSLLCAAFAHLLTLLAGGAALLAAALFISGVAAGVGLPATYALTTGLAEKGAEAKRMGQVLMGWSLGLVLAIPLGALGAAEWGWRSVFAILIIAHLILALATFRLPARRTTQVAPAPVRRLAPLAAKGGWQAYLVCACFMASFHGVYALTGVQSIEGFGRSLGEAGYVGLFYGIPFAAAAYLSRFLDGLDLRQVQLTALLIGGAVMTALGLAPGFWAYLGAIALWGAVNHINLNLILTRINRLMPEHVGAALGLYSTITYIAAMLSTFALSYLYEAFGFGAAALTGAGLHLIAYAILRYRAAALA